MTRVYIIPEADYQAGLREVAGNWFHAGFITDRAMGNPKPVELFDIREIAKECLANSERWFPSNHTDHRLAVTHCTLGLAGEAGETANKVKKLYGYADQRKLNDSTAIPAIIEELVDTLIYDLVLLQLFEADIPQALADKIAVCEARWGGRS